MQNLLEALVLAVRKTQDSEALVLASRIASDLCQVQDALRDDKRQHTAEYQLRRGRFQESQLETIFCAVSVVIIVRVEPYECDRLIVQGAALPDSAVAPVHADGSLLSAIGVQLAALGLAVEQPAQQAGDLAFTRTGIEKPPTCARWKRDEPGGCGFPHVRWIGIEPTFFNSCKSHVCILHENDPGGRDAPKGAMSPRGNRYEYLSELWHCSKIRLKSLLFCGYQILPTFYLQHF